MSDCLLSPQGERGPLGPPGLPGFAGNPVSIGLLCKNFFGATFSLLIPLPFFSFFCPHIIMLMLF